ncbi:tRNA (uracil-5-)-methyltransferase [Paenibacillus sp. J2TS4]|nr:tRNA (uracil-5-)-methyltransferase [Paenibacillus sp. J2TS4]
MKAKEEIVKEAFARYLGEEVNIRPIHGMEHPWSYRNKAQLQVGYQDDRLLTGLYSAGSRRLVDISGCPIQHPEINRTIQVVRGLLEELKVPAYNERTGKGVLRTIVARVGFASDEVQLTLVTGSDKLPRQSQLVEAIRRKLPKVISIAHNVNPDRTPLVFGEVTRILWGRERMEEALGDVRFSLSPRAFFQLNPAQTIHLYNYVREAAALTGEELVVDAYCGTGTIGLWLAPFAREVRGIEAVPEAVEDARRNARLSGLGNASFYAGQAERLLPEWVRHGIRPDVVVVDPPRTGCDRKLLQALAQAKPRRLVYVSCNPSTLAKDCKILTAAGFRIEWAQPVDMFPQTAHVECCVSLIRK